MKARRVVVTGMGILSPVGNTVDEAWGNIRAGKSGIGPIENWDASNQEVRFGGEVRNFDPVELFGRREARRTDRLTQLAWFATQQALTDSGLQITDDNRHQIGAIIGTGLGGIRTIEEGLLAYHSKGPKGVGPLVVPTMLPDSPSGKISIEYGLRGPNMSVTSACATGNNAIGEAASWIQRGICEVVVAGATEAGFVHLSVASFNNMTALSRRNDEPQRASRPFDIERDGFVMSEGAGVLILEELEHAKARGAKIMAEIIGYGLTSDAYHITAPMENGDGARRAIQMALRDAGLETKDIDYINAHGTSTPLNDAMETLAIKQVFGEHAYNIPVSSTKSMTGHLMGAGAAVEAVFCIKAIEDQFAPPTINLDHPDPVCDLDYVPHTGRSVKINTVMSNAFGFGGHNVVIIFGKYSANGS
jgi:3-oxoacyl-[acyl-carrier-protein] synthase II